MRITKTRLRQIIQEEITSVVSEVEDSLDAGGQGPADEPAAKVALALRQFFTSPDTQGVNAKEAGVIQRIIEALWTLAQDATITQGPVASKLQLLANAMHALQEQGRGVGEEEGTTTTDGGTTATDGGTTTTTTATSTGGEPTPGV